MKFYLIIIGILGFFSVTGCSSSQCMSENTKKEIIPSSPTKISKSTTAKAGSFCGDREVSDDF